MLGRVLMHDAEHATVITAKSNWSKHTFMLVGNRLPGVTCTLACESCFCSSTAVTHTHKRTCRSPDATAPPHSARPGGHWKGQVGGLQPTQGPSTHLCVCESVCVYVCVYVCVCVCVDLAKCGCNKKNKKMQHSYSQLRSRSQTGTAICYILR